MNVAETGRSVFRTLQAQPMRAALTLLGVLIGSGSIVLVAGLMRGGRQALLAANQGVNDADLILVRNDDAPAKQRQKTQRGLGVRDADLLAESPLLSGAQISSVASREIEIAAPKKKRARLVGASPNELGLYRLELDRGRFLQEEDLAGRARVCVIGQEIWQEVFPDRAQLGDATLQIENHLWRVVGVLKSKPILGSSDGTWMWNRKILVPRPTFDSLYAPSHRADRLFVRPQKLELGQALDSLVSIIDGTVLRRHLGVHNFKVETSKNASKQFDVILSVMAMLLLSTGLISLFVGGINIMNIMLVTVTERTREIGIRRAVGASRRAILSQFLFESATLSCTGGLLGVLFGLLLSFLASLVLRRVAGAWTFEIELWPIGLGLGLALSAGILFGLFPAWRAARLDPVEALRQE